MCERKARAGRSMPGGRWRFREPRKLSMWLQYESRRRSRQQAYSRDSSEPRPRFQYWRGKSARKESSHHESLAEIQLKIEGESSEAKIRAAAPEAYRPGSFSVHKAQLPQVTIRPGRGDVESLEVRDPFVGWPGLRGRPLCTRGLAARSGGTSRTFQCDVRPCWSLWFASVLD